jgi:predicted metalloprotease
MTFRRGSRLDPSQVEDYRGRRLGGAGGKGIAVGGGGIGVVVIAIVIYLLGGDPSGVIDLNGMAVGGPGDTPGTALQSCRTAEDANAREDCRIVGYVTSVQQYWTAEFRNSGQTYQPATTRFFSGQAQTGCGLADSSSGPFYCPSDKHVYLDLTFFDDLRTKLGATGGPLAQAYVIAHEYGHHVQDLLGVLGRAGDTGDQGGSVRVELQADCYAGVWTKRASDPNGILEPPTEAQLADALNTAQAIGDDRLQRASTGTVHPEQWTHGSSAQRQKWFLQGFKFGDPDQCDTFSGPV